MNRILTQIEKAGQPYIDAAVFREVSKAIPLSRDIAAMFGRPVQPKIEEFSHYDRTHFQWMKPDGNGGLVPR